MKESIKDIVKNPKWQKIRKELVGTWSTSPAENCNKLRSFLGNMKDETKLRIVMNYLTGTGFRTGRIKHPSISKLREDISKALKEVKTNKEQKIKVNSEMTETATSIFQELQEKYSKFLSEAPTLDVVEEPPAGGEMSQPMGAQAPMGNPAMQQPPMDPSVAGQAPMGAGMGADPSMMGGGMGMDPTLGAGYTPPNPYGAMPAPTPKNLGRLYELNKIYYTLKTLDVFLLKLPEVDVIKLRNVSSEALDIFKVIVDNLQVYVEKEMIDDIIISYYKFIKRLMWVIEKFYREKKRDDDKDQNSNRTRFASAMSQVDYEEPFQGIDFETNGK